LFERFEQLERSQYGMYCATRTMRRTMCNVPILWVVGVVEVTTMGTMGTLWTLSDTVTAVPK
jgi:hypothetical protein